jgi:CelD/BcsL family acetyltransferase involved in cellulose biosynthesis
MRRGPQRAADHAVRHNQAVHVVEVPRLGGHTTAWDDLVAAMRLPSPFLRSWWLEAVADGGAAYVLVLDGDRLVGGLPLTKRVLPGLTVYRFLGQGTLCPDHLDVVAAPEHAAVVTDALSQWARRRGNRLFDLAGIAEHSRIPTWLPAARTHEIDGAPCHGLPASADAYFAERPRSFRKTVRRTRNRLDGIGAHITTAGTGDVDAALDAFELLHRARGDRADLLAELPRLRAALRAGVQAGEVWVDVVGSPQQPLAVSIAFVVGGRVSLYQTARALDAAADNASNIVDLAEIDRGIEAGCTEVDLLRGQEAYKRYYADGVRRLFRTRGASGPLARAMLLAIAIARRVRTVSRGLRASGDESGS